MKKSFLFLVFIFLASLVFVYTNSFMRPFDDPKELIFYSSLFLFCLFQFWVSRKEKIFSLDLFQLLITIFIFYLGLNLVMARPPVNEGLVVAGRYVLVFLSILFIASFEEEALVKFMKWPCVFAAIATLVSFCFPLTGFDGLPPIGNLTYSSDFFLILLPWVIYFSSRKNLGRVFFGLVFLILVLGLIYYARKIVLLVFAMDLILILVLFFLYVNRQSATKLIKRIVISFAVFAVLLVMAESPRFHIMGGGATLQRLKEFYIQTTTDGLAKSPRVYY